MSAYSALKNQDILTHATICKTFENIMLRELSQSPKNPHKYCTVWLIIYDVPRAVKFRDREWHYPGMERGRYGVLNVYEASIWEAEVKS